MVDSIYKLTLLEFFVVIIQMKRLFEGLLTEGLEVSTVDGSGRSPLHAIVERNHAR